MRRGSLGLGMATLALLLSSNWQSVQAGQVVAEVQQGPIALKRGDSDYRQVRVGQSLENGDLVKTIRGVSGSIRCTVNGRTWTLPDNGVPLGVTTVCPTSTSQTNLRNQTRVLERSRRWFQFW
jgi:hypothetical protein